MTSLTLRFWDKHISKIRSKDKRLTARYNLNRDIREGYTLRFIDSNNFKFGEAYCTQLYDMPVSEFAMVDWEYHRNYETTKELLDALEGYYPDVPRSEFDTLTVIEWSRTFSPNHVYDFEK